MLYNYVVLLYAIGTMMYVCMEWMRLMTFTVYTKMVNQNQN